MDIVTKPLEAVGRLFKSAGCPLDASADFGVALHFAEMLADRGVLEQVPCLVGGNIDSIPNNTLVRFRGMVQDMLDPEYYMGAARLADGTWITTKYSDAMDSQLNDQTDNRVWERKALYLIPMECESPWAQLQGAEAVATEGASNKKRALDSAGPASEGVDVMDVEAGPQPDQGLPQGADNPQGSDPQLKAKQARSADTGSKAPSAQQQQQQQWFRNSDRGVMVYVYDSVADGPLLHEVVEVVGVLSRAPHLAAMHMDGAGQGDEVMEAADTGAVCHACGAGHAAGACGQAAGSLEEEQMRAAHPPTSQVLRLHAILLTRSPQLAPALPKPLSPPAIHELRSKALSLIAGALGGDSLAAEYVLMQLVARVTSRAGQQPVGVIPLNLITPKQKQQAAAAAAPQQQQAPPPAPAPASQQQQQQQLAVGPLGSALHAALSCLVPLSQALPLSVDSLNRGGWAPKRDYTTNRVAASPLQLPGGTVLLVDETVMAEGQLSEGGVGSLQALHALIREQVLHYDFQFYSQPVPVNLPVVVLSAGRSVLREALPLSVPLCPASEAASMQAVQAAVQAAEQEGWLHQARAFLNQAASAPYVLEEGMAGTLQEEFLSARKQDKSYGPDQFHNKLTLARLAALSHGEGILTAERWGYVNALEQRREARLRVV